MKSDHLLGVDAGPMTKKTAIGYICHLKNARTGQIEKHLSLAAVTRRFLGTCEPGNSIRKRDGTTWVVLSVDKKQYVRRWGR